MRSKAELFEAHATRCRLLAATASDKDAEQLLLEAASDWTNLAALLRSLQADLKHNNDNRR